ncbi:MAG TPA: hypothetical protein PKY82_32085 [Pyrinomonadaceae bacterium]|nr:hypothetical protein [Pyrinomonadaceae bacterium]
MMISLGLTAFFLVRMLTDFKQFYDKKMRANSNLHLVVFFAIGSMLVSCEKKGMVVTFENICREENQKRVELKGFLNFSQKSFMTMPYHDFYQQQLLVENKNGTGGFIEVLFEDGKVSKPNGAVKIIGKVIKVENSCVLQVEKVETQ